MSYDIQQQIADFKEATGIQLEIKDGKPFYDGGLNLSYAGITELPDNLTVNGSLSLNNTKIERLPEGLKVEGNLDLFNTPIKELPDDLKVEGALNLPYTPIKKLPEGLVVNGDLNLYGSKIEKLPEGLHVKGTLDLGNTTIKELPERLTVEGSLRLKWSNIEKLTEGVKVNGLLLLDNTPIKELPKGLTVEESLDLHDTPIKELPDGLTVKGDLKLYDTDIERLPKNLTVGGTLDLRNTPIKELPEGLTVGGNLWLEDTDIEKLPEDLKVEKDLDINNTPIKELPQGLTVKGSLELSNTPIQELPENLTVGRSLWLENTPIERLPDGLTVKGDLWLKNSNIERLPEGLKVNGDLNLSDTHIEALPKGLTVEGELGLENTPIKELPNDLKVKGDIYMNNQTIEATPENKTPDGYIDLAKAGAPIAQNTSPSAELQQQIADFKEVTGIQLDIKDGKPYYDDDLDLSDTNVKRLPDGLTVKWSLWLSNTPIKELPEGLKVGGDLWLENTPIERLPENLTVGGNLWLENTPIERLPENLTVGGNLWLNHSEIEQLPERLKVEGWLGLENTPIKELPENLTVGGGLWLNDSKIEKLPNNLTVNGDLGLSNTPIKELPDDLKVDGDLWLYNSKIEKLPNNLTVNGDLGLSNTTIKELPENLTVGGSLWLNNTNIEKLPENLTVKGDLDLDGSKIERLPEGLKVEGWLNLCNTAIKELPDDLKVKENIYMNNQTIEATPENRTPDGYIDLVKATQQEEMYAVVRIPDYDGGYTHKIFTQKEAEEWAQQDFHYIEWRGTMDELIKNADNIVFANHYEPFHEKSYDINVSLGELAIKAGFIKMNESYNEMMTSLAQKTPKDRPSDIVFIKEFSLEDTTKPIYTAYGKDADRLAEKVSSSVAAMRPEIEGKYYPRATVNSGNIEGVRADLMLKNIHPIIIDVDGKRITDDKTLDYTKEERKTFLDSLKPEAKQLASITETLQRLGDPESVMIPRTAEHPNANPSLFIPHRFGTQEIALAEIKKSKNGIYHLAGNEEEGFVKISKLDTNNLFVIDQALQKAEKLLPQNLVKELLNQVKEGKAEVKPLATDGRFIITINDPDGRNGAYERGFKQFTVGKDLKDEILRHNDWNDRSRIIKVDPQVVQQLVSYAETKLNIKNQETSQTNANEKRFAVVREPDNSGGYKHHIYTEKKAEEIAKKDFHHIEWRGTINDLIKDADKVSFNNHKGPWEKETYDSTVTLAELALNAGIIVKNQNVNKKTDDQKMDIDNKKAASQQTSSPSATNQKDEQQAQHPSSQVADQQTQQKEPQIKNLSIKYVDDEWRLSANINGKQMRSVPIAETDVLDYKHGVIDKQGLVNKAYGDIPSHNTPANKQEEKRSKGRGR